MNRPNTTSSSGSTTAKRTIFRDKLIKSYNTLNLSQKLYVTSFLFLSTLLLSYLIFDKNSGEFVVSFVLYFAFLGISIAYDLSIFFSKIKENIVGKGVIGVLAALCTNFSLSIACQIVNNITGADPAKFPHTIALISIMSIPFFVVIGFSFLYAAIFVLISPIMFVTFVLDEASFKFIFPWRAAKEPLPFRRTTRLAQVLSASAFCGMVFGTAHQAAPLYDQFVADSAKSFLFNFEMLQKSHCSQPVGSKIAFVGEGKILVAMHENSGIAFSTRDCKASEQTP